MREVYRATYEWWLIVNRQGRVMLNTDVTLESTAESLYDAACKLAGYDPEDLENSVAFVAHVGDEDSAIRIGDLAVFGGYGADVVFVRLDQQGE